MRGRFRTIQNNSGLPQGPGPPFGGSLMVRRSMRAICDPRRSHHETAGGRGAAGLGCRHHGSRVLFGPDPRGDIAVGIHSRLSARLRRRPARAPTGGKKAPCSTRGGANSYRCSARWPLGPSWRARSSRRRRSSALSAPGSGTRETVSLHAFLRSMGSRSMRPRANPPRSERPQRSWFDPPSRA